jgi:hypothetical protein
MAAQAEAENDPMYDMMKNLPKVLEINPKSPLIEGMLERVLDLDEGDVDEKELVEAVRVLFDTTLVRSGFSVADPARSVHSFLVMIRAHVKLLRPSGIDAEAIDRCFTLRKGKCGCSACSTHRARSTRRARCRCR